MTTEPENCARGRNKNFPVLGQLLCITGYKPGGKAWVNSAFF